jgi:integral membrane sensor domain MASE1
MSSGRVNQQFATGPARDRPCFRRPLTRRHRTTAAIYFVAGKLALLLAIPPGYATAVWPAAGLALGCLLLFGDRVWPGVVIGSFLVNFWTSLDTASLGAILRSVAVPALIGAGAALQALAGTFLVRRFVRMPTVLATEKEVVRFSLVASGSCLVASERLGWRRFGSLELSLPPNS